MFYRTSQQGTLHTYIMGQTLHGSRVCSDLLWMIVALFKTSHHIKADGTCMGPNDRQTWHAQTEEDEGKERKANLLERRSTLGRPRHTTLETLTLYLSGPLCGALVRIGPLYPRHGVRGDYGFSTFRFILPRPLSTDWIRMKTMFTPWMYLYRRGSRIFERRGGGGPAFTSTPPWTLSAWCDPPSEKLKNTTTLGHSQKGGVQLWAQC